MPSSLKGSALFSFSNCPTEMKPVLLLTFFYLMNLLAFGQGFSLSDTTITFLNKEGKVMMKDEVMTFMKEGTFNTRTEISSTGKKIITLTRPDQGAMSQMVKARYEWTLQMRGKALLPFHLTNLDGKTIHSDDFKGKVLILNFWFTQCKPCIAEMPELNKLVDNNKGRDVLFLGITFDQPETVQKFLKRFPFSFQVLTNARSYVDQLQVQTYPTTLVVDKEGMVKDIFVDVDPFLFTKIQVAIDALEKVKHVPK